MAGLMCALFGLVYCKRHKVGVTLGIVIVLALVLAGASSWLLWRGTLSKDRIVMDRVDHRIMYIVDLKQRACFLLRLLSDPGYQDRTQKIFQTAREYIRQLEQPIVQDRDLSFLSSRFRVQEVPAFSAAESLAYYIGGLCGISVAASIALLAAGYLTFRIYFKPETATLAGLFLTGALLLAGVVWLTPKSGELGLRHFPLLFPAAAAVLLHWFGRRESILPLEIASVVLLAISVALFALSSRALLLVGEDTIRKNVDLMNATLPKVMQDARSFGDQLDRYANSPQNMEEQWNPKAACYDLNIRIGSLEELLGNVDPQAKSAKEFREFDPYREDFELFRRNPLGSPQPP